MGYIKKLKNNELVGGTDKTTIYPVTSTEAVFEEVSENNFQSQKAINVDRLERIETLEDHDENHEGRVSTLEEHDSDHESRVQELEGTMPTTVKSVTINGGTKTYTVDEEGNVNLDVYTTESAEGQATLAEEVGDIRSIVGTKDASASGTLVNRVGELETLVGGSGEGSVNTRIANAVDSLDVPSTTVTDTTGHVSVTLAETDGKINSLAVATEDIASDAEFQELKSHYTALVNGSQIVLTTSVPTASQASANVIYRVYNSTPDGSYSDYMLYNGSVVKIATYNISVLDPQVSYYKCKTVAATAAKVVNATDNPDHPHLSAYSLTTGGHIKIWMEHANTAASGVTLQIGNQAAKALLYNNEVVSAHNTWEDGEVISVYYDPSYNNSAGAYYASNALGGGSAAGKKKLVGNAGYVDLSGETALAPKTSGSGTWQQYRYIQYPVEEGDVVYIKGVGGGTLAYTWGLIDSTNNRAIVESAGGIVDYTQKPFVKVIPSGVDTIIINNYNTAYENYEWYFAKKDSAGAHEILTEAYIYKDLRTFALGENYDLDEIVKTDNKQLLRVTKEITAMTLTDNVVIGDLRTYSSNTYQAQTAVNAYNGTETEGLYAIGSPAGAEIQVTVDSEVIAALTEAATITVTIAGIEVSVDNITSEDGAADVAGKIASAFGTQAEWALTDNEDGTLTLKSKVGKAAAPTISSDTGTTGVTVEIVEGSDYAGSISISMYDGSTWSEVTYADSGVWGNALTIYELANVATKQNSLQKDIDQKLFDTYNTLGEERFDITNIKVEGSNHNYIAPTKLENGGSWRGLKTGTDYIRYASFRPITIFQEGDLILISFDYVSTIRYNTTVYLRKSISKDKYDDVTSDTCYTLPKRIPANSSGTYEAVVSYVEGANMLAFGFYQRQDETLTVTNVSIKKYDNVLDKAKRHDGIYNVSKNFPTGGVDNGNTYTLTSAIAKVPSSERFAGMVISYIDSTINKYYYCRYIGTDITTFTNTAYWEFIYQKGIETNGDYRHTKLLQLASNTTNSRARAVGFLHFSDLHSDSVAYSELQAYILNYGNWFDDIIETGDNVFETSSDVQLKVTDKALFVLGNHDGSTTIAGHDCNKTKEWCFQNFFEPYLDAWGVGTENGVHFPEGWNVSGSDYENALYWYKDYDYVRLIGLDCMHHLGRNNNLTDESQELWFKDTLDDAKEKGLKVMVACHYYLDHWNGEYARWNDSTHKWEYNFISDDTNSNTGGIVMNEATGRRVPFHPFNTWPTDIGTGIDDDWGSLRIIQSGTAYAVNTNRFGDILSDWISDGGTFIAWIAGHAHFDYMFYPVKYPNILNIGVTSTGTRRQGKAHGEKYYHLREDGVNNRLAANAYYINGDYLSIIRVGYNMSYQTLIPFTWMTINYKTGQVVSCG